MIEATQLSPTVQYFTNQLLDRLQAAHPQQQPRFFSVGPTTLRVIFVGGGNHHFFTVARQVSYLQAHPDTDACFGYVQPFISPDLPIDVQATIACSDRPLPGWLKQTMLIRREKFSETSFFDPNYHTGGFIDWFIRAKEAGLWYVMLPAVVTRRRLHPSGLASQTRYHKEFAHILKATLDRRATR